MSIYEKRDDVYCGSCGRFTRHYIWYVPPRSPDAGRFMPLGVGHCAYPRIFSARIESVFLVYGGAAVELLPTLYSSSSSDHEEIMRISPVSISIAM